MMAAGPCFTIHNCQSGGPPRVTCSIGRASDASVSHERTRPSVFPLETSPRSGGAFSLVWGLSECGRCTMIWETSPRLRHEDHTIKKAAGFMPATKVFYIVEGFCAPPEPVEVNAVSAVRCSPLAFDAPLSIRASVASSIRSFFASRLHEIPSCLRTAAISSPKHCGGGNGSYPRNSIIRGR